MIIEEFEDLINSDKSSERDIQRFLEAHPEFLTGLGYEEAIPQVMLRDLNGDTLIPDFIMKPIAGVSYQAKIVELKLPSQPIIRPAPRRERLYAHVHEGVAQLQAYARYFEIPENRAFVQNALGFSMYRPHLSLVIGRSTLPERQWLAEDILRSVSPVEINTYNDLLERYRWMTREKR